MNNNTIVLDVHERPKTLVTWVTLSFQHLLAMFGSTVLVPIILGLDPNTALVTGGTGTLIFLLITRGKVPAYVSSSFAFISPIILMHKQYGLDTALICASFSGVVYVAVSIGLKLFGNNWLLKLLPTHVTGPVMIVIGLGLASTAVSEAFTLDHAFNHNYFYVSMITLVSTGLFALLLPKPFSLSPFLFAIVLGYIVSYFLGIVDFSKIATAPFISVPQFRYSGLHLSNIHWIGVVSIIPIAFVTISEHIGHQLVLNTVTNKNYLKTPGLHISILGDGLATIFSGLLGSVPNTTYGENIAVLAVTRVYSVYVIMGAAIIAIILGFVGKISAFLQTIPAPVIGGFSILLFGIIASSGVRNMVDKKVNLGSTRILIIVSAIMVLGIGCLPAYAVSFGKLQLSGMGLSAISGIILNAILPKTKEDKEAEKLDLI